MKAGAAGMRLAGTLCQQSQPRATVRCPGYLCRGLPTAFPASFTAPTSPASASSHWHTGSRRRLPTAKADIESTKPGGASGLSLSPPHRPGEFILEAKHLTGSRHQQSTSKQAPLFREGTRTPGRAVEARARRMGGVPRAGQAVEAVPSTERQQPVLLLDVMDTIVADPFHWHIPHFFGLSMEELLQQKHPTAWVQFEKGQLTEEELQAIFFNDGRDFDLQGLKVIMQEAYAWMDGMEPLLRCLKDRGVEMHAFTNYPLWYLLIEEKLQLSRYLSWTFVSCYTGMRKPDPLAYTHAAEHLHALPSQCVFVDDRKTNVAAAVAAGMRGIHFSSAHQLSEEISSIYGIPLQELTRRSPA